MLRKEPEYRKKTEEAAQKRDKAEQQANHKKVIASLERIADQHKAADNEAKRSERFHRKLEKITNIRERRRFGIDVFGVIGIYIAAGVAAWAVCDAHQSSNKQYAAMRDQQTVMQGQLDEMRNEQRAWIYTDPPVINSAITKNPNGTFVVSITFNIHNTGHLPALYVWPYFKTPAASDDVTGLQKSACLPISHKSAMGDTVFPGQVFPRRIGAIGFTPSEWAESITKQRFVRPLIVGCLRYESPGDNTMHASRFAFYIERRLNPNDLDTFGLPADPTSIPINQLIVTPIETGDTFKAD